MGRTRVYSPENEPFDVPDTKATELRLQHGWTSHPLDPNATPAVQSTVTEPVKVADDWRGTSGTTAAPVASVVPTTPVAAPAVTPAVPAPK